MLVINPNGSTFEFVTVRDLLFQPDSGSAGGVAIYIDTASVSNSALDNLVLERLYVTAHGSYAIQLNNSTQNNGLFTSAIRDCKLANGINLQNTGDSVSIERCVLTGTGAAITLKMTDWWNSTGGFRVASSQTTIADCNITTTGKAIDVSNGRGVRILRNNIENTAPAGPFPMTMIDLHGAAPRGGQPGVGTLQMCVVEGNYFGFGGPSGTYGNLLNIDYADSTVVRNNTFDIGNAELTQHTNGINVTANATNSLVSLNEYLRSSEPGSNYVDAGEGTRGTLRLASLATGWSQATGGSAATPSYTKLEENIVLLKVMVVFSGTASQGSTIFTLPNAYAPSQERSFMVSTSDKPVGGPGPWTLTPGEIRKQPGGQVQYWSGLTANMLSLDGVSFLTE